MPLPNSLSQQTFVRNRRPRSKALCRRSSDRSGFSLVEVMVAIVVMGIVFVSAFATVTQQVRTVEMARDYTRVAQILQSEIEDLRTKNWIDLEAISTSSWEEITVSSDFTNLYGNRYRVWRLIRDRSGTTDQKEILVYVGWLDGHNNWRFKITTTWFTENGMNDYFYRSF